MKIEKCKMARRGRRRSIFHFPFSISHLSLLFLVTLFLPAVLNGQETPPPQKPNLANDQDAIKARYKRFNLTLQQMAEILRKQDPERADLLFRALGKSQETRVEDQMQLIYALLNKEQPQLGEAIERQEELVAQLKNLLDLLQSEDRRSEIEKEKQRLQDLLKDINKMIGKEKDVRAGTERGDDSKKLASKQDEIAKDAEKLGQKIDKQDAEKNGEVPPNSKAQKSGSESKDPQSGDQKPDDKKGKPGDDKKPGEEKNPEKDKKPSDGKKPEDKEGKPSDMNKGDKPKDGSKPQGKEGQPSDRKQEGKPQDGKPMDGQPQDGQPMPMQDGDQKPQDQQDGQQQNDPKKQKTPGRKQLEESRDAMQRAIEELKKQKRDDASKEQDEAIKKLMEAKEKIEEILRQLREEEQKLMLAALEARFKKMLAAQLIIYHDTVRLSKADPSEKASVQARAVKLAQGEQEILIDADKALILLKEEGSSIAFPESVAGIRQDVQSLVGWLRDAKVGELTQAVEKDVIEALEELIEALQKEMEKSDEDKKKQQQQQQQQEQSQPLVDQLAELKMLRSLQLRVNRRTKQLSRTFEGEQATQEESVQQLQQLSGRQARIQQATSDLVKGKNK
jgi:hypothetical protein